MPEDVVCARCGEGNAATQRFCGACGAPLTLVCPSCGEANPPSFRFCGACGTGLVATASGEPALDAAPAARQVAAREERRWATTLFADLSGFTSLSERSDPEDVRTIADRCAVKLGAIVERYGGWVNRVIGDAILAVFGAPVAHEDDAERAVRAAFDMQRCAVENAEDFGGLALRIGINTGETMFAPVGPEGAREFTVMGDAVNTAARLQAAAPRSGILVGRETHRATARAIRYEPIEPITAKGKEEPVAAWLAAGLLAAPADRPISSAPMVGREGEMEVLRSAWERVRSDERPHLVTILGPPGMGKSRLTREFTGGLEAAGARTLRGRSLPYGESTGYGAFSEILRSFAGIDATDAAPAARDKLEAAVGTLLAGEEAGEVMENLARLASLAGGAGGDRATLFHAARRFVEALARERPHVLVFEDIHWADPTLLDLLETLAARVRDAPVMLLTLARPELLERRPGWAGGLSSYTALPLAPLADEEARALAAGLLAEADASLVGRVGEAGGGNPLFIEELARSLAERGSLALDEPPSNVKAIIAARLDMLPETQRRVLLDASVVGKLFWRGALRRPDGETSLDEALDALEARDLIRREPSSRIGGDREFVFKHMLIREVAYSLLPRADRRARHAAVARFVEQALGERVVESASLVAHHWREGGDAARALRYLLVAAERARAAWAKGEAISLYAQAIELVPDGDVERRRDLRLQRAVTMSEGGDYPGALAEIDALLPELDGPGRLDALYTRGLAAYWMGRTDDVGAAERELEAAAAAAGLAGVYSPLVSELRMFGASMRGDLEAAREVGERALADWSPDTPAPTERAGIVGLMSLYHLWIGDFEAARSYAASAYAMGVESQSVDGTLIGGAHFGLALAGRGRHEEAIRFLEELVGRGREIELQPRLTARAMNALAGTMRELHDLAGARQRNAEAIELADRASFANARVQGKIDLLYADLVEREPGRVEVALASVEEDATSLRGWHEWLAALRLADLRARTALATGRSAEAAEEAARALAGSVRRRKYDVSFRTTLGAALCAEGRPDEGIAELRRAASEAAALGHPPTRWETEAALAAVLSARGDDDGAAAAHAEARAAIEGLASGLSAERRERLLAAPAVAVILDAR